MSQTNHSNTTRLLPFNNNNNRKFPPPFSSDAVSFDYLYYSANLSQVGQVWQDDVIFLPLCILYSCAFVFGILGNVLVIISHVANSKRRSSTSSFLVGLAVSDILFLLVCTPHDLMTRMERDIAGGKLLCKVGWFIEMVTTSGSVLSLVAVSVERYIVIVHPMRSRSWCSGSRITKVMVALWCIATIISIPLLYIQDTRRYVYYDTDDYITIVSCADVNGPTWFRKSFNWFQLLAIFLLPVLSMFFCYSVVSRVLWKSTKQLSQLTEDKSVGILIDRPCLKRTSDKSETRNANRGRHSPAHLQSMTSASDVTWFGDDRLERKTTTTMMMLKPCGKDDVRRNAAKSYGDLKESRKQVIKMLMIIILIFFLFIGPKWCWNILKRYRIEGMTSNAAFIVGIILNFLPFLHTCANPIIYGFLSSSFRVGLRTAFSHLNSKLRSCCGDKYYVIFCCCIARRGDEEGRGCCWGCHGNKFTLRRDLTETCNDSLTNYNSCLREAWCQQDETTTAATTVTTVVTKPCGQQSAGGVPGHHSYLRRDSCHGNDGGMRHREADGM